MQKPSERHKLTSDNNIIKFKKPVHDPFKICFHCTWTAWIYAYQLENDGVTLYTRIKELSWCWLEGQSTEPHFETNDWHWKTKGLCTFHQESNWNGPISIEFQIYRCWVPLLGLITLDLSSNSKGACSDLLIHPRKNYSSLQNRVNLKYFT